MKLRKDWFMTFKMATTLIHNVFYRSKLLPILRNEYSTYFLHSLLVYVMNPQSLHTAYASLIIPSMPYTRIFNDGFLSPGSGLWMTKSGIRTIMMPSSHKSIGHDDFAELAINPFLWSHTLCLSIMFYFLDFKKNVGWKPYKFINPSCLWPILWLTNW